MANLDSMLTEPFKSKVVQCWPPLNLGSDLLAKMQFEWDQLVKLINFSSAASSRKGLQSHMCLFEVGSWKFEVESSKRKPESFVCKRLLA